MLEIDRLISYKFAHLFDLHSPFRRLFQIITLTGTSVFWFLFVGIWFLSSGSIEAKTAIHFSIFMLIPVFSLKQIIRRQRPAYKDMRMGAVFLDEWSFPSGHASRATYLIVLLSVYFPNLLLLWLLWGVLLYISRLVLGVHYLSDILGGMLISLGFMLLFYVIGWLPETPFDFLQFI